MQTRSMRKQLLEATPTPNTKEITLIISELSSKKKREKISEVNAKEFEVDIDFDEASLAWRSNKKSLGSGHYKYVCIKTKRKCKRETCVYCNCNQ